MSKLPDKLPPRKQLPLRDDEPEDDVLDDTDELDNVDACWLAQQWIDDLR